MGQKRKGKDDHQISLTIWCVHSLLVHHQNRQSIIDKAKTSPEQINNGKGGWLNVQREFIAMVEHKKK